MNKSSHFDDTAEVEEHSLDEIKEYTAEDILKMDHRQVDRMIFIVKNPESEKNEKEIPRYIQIKRTTFTRNNQIKHIIQMINISHTILYNQQKTENKFLGLINACVSHEIRNPLNSIIASNVERKFLYKQINKLVNKISGNYSIQAELKSILGELKKGRKVQQSSADLMKFIVQDLLD
jgi:signal transduction histidine kinase